MSTMLTVEFREELQDRVANGSLVVELEGGEERASIAEFLASVSPGVENRVMGSRDQADQQLQRKIEIRRSYLSQKAQTSEQELMEESGSLVRLTSGCSASEAMLDSCMRLTCPPEGSSISSVEESDEKHGHETHWPPTSPPWPLGHHESCPAQNGHSHNSWPHQNGHTSLPWLPKTSQITPSWLTENGHYNPTLTTQRPLHEWPSQSANSNSSWPTEDINRFYESSSKNALQPCPVHQSQANETHLASMQPRLPTQTSAVPPLPPPLTSPRAVQRLLPVSNSACFHQMDRIGAMSPVCCTGPYTKFRSDNKRLKAPAQQQKRRGRLAIHLQQDVSSANGQPTGEKIVADDSKQTQEETVRAVRQQGQHHKAAIEQDTNSREQELSRVKQEKEQLTMERDQLALESSQLKEERDQLKRKNEELELNLADLRQELMGQHNVEFRNKCLSALLQDALAARDAALVARDSALAARDAALAARDAALSQLAGQPMQEERGIGDATNKNKDALEHGDARVYVEDNTRIGNAVTAVGYDVACTEKKRSEAAGSSSGRSSPDGQEIQRAGSKPPQPSNRDETKQTTAANTDLEQSLERMQREFEAMEDYWQAKLEAERRFHEAQLAQSEEHFNQQEARLREFELMLLDNRDDGDEEEEEELDLEDQKLTQIDEEGEEEEEGDGEDENENDEGGFFETKETEEGAENNAGRDEMQQETRQLKELLKQLEQQLDIHKQLIEEKEAYLQQLRSNSSDQLTKREISHRKELEEVRKLHRNQLEQQLTSHNEQMTQLKRAHAEQLQQLKRAHKEQLLQLKKRHKEQLLVSQQHLQQAFETKLQQLVKSYDMQVAKQKSRAAKSQLAEQATHLSDDLEEEEAYKDYLE